MMSSANCRPFSLDVKDIVGLSAVSVDKMTSLKISLSLNQWNWVSNLSCNIQIVHTLQQQCC